MTDDTPRSEQRHLENNPLSPRERECLVWVTRGKTSWEIGQIIETTERTVNFHIENCKKKLDVKRRAEAAVKALVQGYIET